MQNLVPYKRYTFYYNQKDYPHIRDKTFRATFLDIFNERTLRVYSYTDRDNMESKLCMRTMPLEWVCKAISLEEMVLEQTIFPEDIVFEIDSYY